MNSGQVSIILTVVGAIVAGIWQGSAINTTLTDSVRAEREARQSEYVALSNSIEEITKDVRELRSYVMVREQFPDHHK